MKKRSYKFCPRCGARLSINDGFCTACGYSFISRARNRKKFDLKKMLILVLVLAVLWVLFRTLAKKPIIPEVLVNITKSFFQNKTR